MVWHPYQKRRLANGIGLILICLFGLAVFVSTRIRFSAREMNEASVWFLVALAASWATSELINLLSARVPRIRKAIDRVFLGLCIPCLLLTLGVRDSFSCSSGGPEYVTLTMREWCLHVVFARSGSTVHEVESGDAAYVDVTIPFWIPMLLIPPITAMLWFDRLGRRLGLVGRDYAIGFCNACGYDLQGNASGICPECGTPLK